MTKQKLTPWYPPRISPVHKGMYERVEFMKSKPYGRPWRRFWNGSLWEEDGMSAGIEQEYFYWRGIAK